ncbi:MAG TPA: septum formation initiator family protein [Naasia sp.]|jgi:cell division protein FtsB
MSKPRAPRTVTVPVDLPEESSTASWLRSIRLSGFSVLMLGVVVLAIVVLAPQVRMLVEQRQQIAELEAAVAAQQRDVEDLQEQRARWDDPAYIKAQARDRLLYVMPGEYAYLILDDVAAPADAQPAPAKAGLEETRVDWAASCCPRGSRRG